MLVKFSTGSVLRKGNKVQYIRHRTLKDCYKYSFIPRSIVQWNNIDASDELPQFKASLTKLDLHIGGPSYKY